MIILTVIVALPPNDTDEPFIVIAEFANLAFAIEPANWVSVIPPLFTVTAPELTEKSSLEKDAIPLLDVVASSPAMVISSSDTVVSIPSPPEKVNVLPVEKLSFEPLSAASVKLVSIETEPPNDTPEPFIVIDEFASLALAIEPANCVFVIPPALTVTAPELTAKSSELNDAIPLLEVDASSPAIVIKFPVIVVSIPSPPTKLTSSPKLISKVLDENPSIKKVEIWEDSITNIREIRELCEARGLVFVGHQIDKDPFEIEMTEEEYKDPAKS